MNSRKFASINALDGSEDQFAKPGRILGLYVLVTGTNKAGQVGTAKDVGRFLVERGGDQKINADFAEFRKIMNTRSGISVLNSTDGGAFEAACFIPFFEESFPNCLNISEKNELNVEYQPAASVGTVFNDLNVEIWQREADYPENYVYNIGAKNANYGAAVNTDPVQIGQRNVSAIYIDDQDDILEDFALEVNGRTVVGTASELLLRSITLQENEIEDTNFDFVKIPVFTPGRRNTLNNRGSVATISASGAGNIRMLICSVER